MSENTEFEMVIDSFLEKIKHRVDFFVYDGVSEEERVEIINVRAMGLLKKAIANLQQLINPMQPVNFNDYNDTMECFNFQLTDYEIDLLSDLMVLKLYQEDTLKVSRIQQFKTAGKISTVSLKDERNSLLEFHNSQKKAFNGKLSSYNLTDRLTGNYLI